MSLLKTIKNWFRKSADNANEALKDPVSDGKFAIEDAKKEVSKFQNAIQDAIASTKLLEKQREEQKALVKKYLSIAEQAVAAGNDNDAREALQYKVNAQSQVDTLTTQIKKCESDIVKQRELLEKTKDKIEKAENDHARLSANLKAQESRKALADATNAFSSSDSPLAALGDLEKAVNKAEAEAEAAEIMSENPSDDLEEKYAPQNQSVEEELAKLKAKK